MRHMQDIIKNIVYGNEVMDNILSIREIHGGCINQAFHVLGKNEEVFIKMNNGPSTDVFSKEVRGLQLLKNPGKLQVPECLKSGVFEGHHFLVLSYISAVAPFKQYWENMGNCLAEMHKISFHSFGLDFDNYIGALPQNNGFSGDWIDFFIYRRLEPQLMHALQTHEWILFRTKFELLYKKLPQLLEIEVPALLHGDLWSGNVLSDAKGIPYFIDPAVYYGHRETELAFTTLFGGFPQAFYSAYEENFPLLNGFKERFDIYNLYPLLVHHNLFGGNYLQQVRFIVNKYIR
jgi:protein-ribulosamine 3-kinase